MKVNESMFKHLLKHLAYKKCSFSPIHLPPYYVASSEISCCFLPFFSEKFWSGCRSTLKKKKNTKIKGRFQNQTNISYPMPSGFFKVKS